MNAHVRMAIRRKIGYVMVHGLIPDEIKEFILRTVDSVAQLEALLLLRANPELKWTADAVAGRLYIRAEEAVPWLERLCAASFLVSTGERPPLYHYQPCSAELGQMVDRLADVYARHLVAVTHLIHSKPRTRVREFADAFRLKKD